MQQIPFTSWCSCYKFDAYYLKFDGAMLYVKNTIHIERTLSRPTILNSYPAFGSYSTIDA